MRYSLLLLIFTTLGCTNEVPRPQYQEVSLGKYPCTISDSIKGIDVSYHNGSIQWKILKDNHPEIQFAFIRATVGLNKDPKYQEYLEGANDVGLLNGAYHYYWSNRNSAIQFNNFKNAVDMDKHELIPVLDVEKPSKYGADNLRQGIANWLKLAEEEYGVKPMIYTNLNFYNEYLRGYFSEYPKWIAAYSRCPSTVDWDMHQYSDTGKVKGIKGDVDLNYSDSLFSFRVDFYKYQPLHNMGKTNYSVVCQKPAVIE